MKTSKLSKHNEVTQLAVLKKYDSVEKANAIYDRARNRINTQVPLHLIDDTVIFDWVEGEPLMYSSEDRKLSYLTQYVGNLERAHDDKWAFRFYCTGSRAMHPAILEKIPTILNRNWHGDMCCENVIDSGRSFTDIDVRPEPYGDVYYDLGKFLRSLMYDSLTDSYSPDPEPNWFFDWLSWQGFHASAVRVAAGIVLVRMGKLHNRKDFIYYGEQLCKA